MFINVPYLHPYHLICDPLVKDNKSKISSDITNLVKYGLCQDIHPLIISYSAHY